MEGFSKDSNIFYENFVYLNACKLWDKSLTIDGLVVRVFYRLFIGFGSTMHLITSDFNKGYSSDFVEDCAMVFSFIGINLSIMGFQYKHSAIIRLVEELNVFKTFGKPFNFDQTRKFIDKCIVYYKYMVILGLLYYSSLGFINKSKCLKHKKETQLERVCGLVVQTWSPIDIESAPKNQIVFVLQTMAGLLCVSAYGSIYSFIFAMSEHIILRIKNLKHSLKQMHEMMSLEMKEEHFKKCIIYHNSIIQFTDKLNDCFSKFLFVTVLFDTIIIGILALQFLLENSLHILLHLMGWVMTLLIVSVTGQRLLDESVSVPHCVYNLNWYEYPPKLRKYLVLMILRSQKPLALKTGDFGIMSFATFLAILKTSYSYITLLKQTM